MNSSGNVIHKNTILFKNNFLKGALHYMQVAKLSIKTTRIQVVL